jgi:hypothetical protein
MYSFSSSTWAPRHAAQLSTRCSRETPAPRVHAAAVAPPSPCRLALHSSLGALLPCALLQPSAKIHTPKPAKHPTLPCRRRH